MDIVDGMIANAKQQQGKIAEVDGYPVDTQEVIDAVCKLWRLRPPRNGKSKAYWIQAARELDEAIGEYKIYDLLFELHADWCKKMVEIKQRTGQGCAPYPVEGPGSLIKMARSKAGEWRSEETGGTMTWAEFCA